MSQKSSNPVSGLHHRLAYIDSELRHALGSIETLKQQLDRERQADGGLAAELYNLDKSLKKLDQCMQKMQDNGRDSLMHKSDEHNVSELDGERELLIQALDAQENRIRQLEEQLRVLACDDEKLIDNSSRHDEGETTSVITNESLKDDPHAQRVIVTIQAEGNLKIALNNAITTIGREPANDVQIRSRFVSRFHARIVNDDAGALIEDLDSRNGVSINAERVSRQRLKSGDFIKIGRVQLQYIDIMEGTFDGGAA